jgi:hypothetical protein
VEAANSGAGEFLRRAEWWRRVLSYMRKAHGCRVPTMAWFLYKNEVILQVC